MMALLGKLLTGIEILEQVGPSDIEILDVTIDSRQVKPGTMFIARKGTAVDGHDFIDRALEKGASAVVCEQMPATIKAGVTFTRVLNSIHATSDIAGNLYNNPSDHIELVGITGTNGKTTVATVCYQLMQSLGYKCGLISTVECKVGDAIFAATHTTPDIISTNALLRKMVDAGCTHAFMEVSSHALHQERTHGLRFVGGVFTNISHDHLDYHKTFQAYINAKKLLFDNLDRDAYAIINADSKQAGYMVQNCKARIYKYGLRSAAEFRARLIENSKDGLHLQIDGKDLFCFLKGAYNAYNLMAAYAVAAQYLEDDIRIMEAISQVRGATGRFEIVWGESKGVMGIVDYAHTPEALENVLDTIHKFSSGKSQRIITVVGCGGDRDRTKRPKMARAVASRSDLAVFTSDNPRSEDPAQIIEEMKTGLVDETGKEYEDVRECEVFSLVDRKEAIRLACKLSKEGDVILIAGKGHETYQETKGTKVPFDDKIVLSEFIP